MAASAEKKQYSTILHTVVILFFYFGFQFIPPFLSMTEQGMKILGIFLGLVYGLSTIGGIWPSILAIFAIPMTGSSTLAATFASGLGCDSSFLMLFMMVFAELLAANDVTKNMAYWLMSRNFLNGRPWVISFVILYGMLLLGSLGATFGLIIIFWSVITTIAKEANMKPYDKWPTLMIFGVVQAALFTSSMWLFRGNPLFLSQAYQQASGIALGMLPYTMFNFILATIAIIVYTLLCKYIFKADVTPLKSIDLAFIKQHSKKMNTKQKLIIFTFIGAVVTIMSVGFMPKTWVLQNMLAAIGNSGCTALWLVPLMIIHIDGKPILDFKIAAKGIMWDVWFLAAAVLSVAAPMLGEGMGFRESLLTIVGPILSGHGTMVFTILCVVLSVFLTNIMANTVVGLMFVPVIYSCAVQMGINGTPTLVLMLVCIHLAIITPAASPFAAMLFGNTEWVKPADVYRYGIISVVILLILLIIVGIPLANMLF